LLGLLHAAQETVDEAKHLLSRRRVPLDADQDRAMATEDRHRLD
jgi:hypothetical protein